MNLSDLLTGSQFGLGPPEYVHAPVGPNRTLPCLAWAVLLVTSEEGPLVVFVRRGDDNGPVPGLMVQAVASNPEFSPRFLTDLRRLMAEHDVFRGQVITIEADRRGGHRVVFLERPTMSRGDLVLPDGLLERVERHVIGPTQHREELLARLRHLGRGLLLWGPPGTGKTHTVRYLTSQLREATVIILSGASLGMVGAFGNLARRLAPAVVVLEDVDLIAQERTFGPFGSSPALFELMNEMSGLAEDADVAFILTTNRPDALEPALAARPGRVDLAVEIPLPDPAARRQLLDLYARGLNLDGVDLDATVGRTEGMTASFFQGAAPQGNPRLGRGRPHNGDRRRPRLRTQRAARRDGGADAGAARQQRDWRHSRPLAARMDAGQLTTTTRGLSQTSPMRWCCLVVAISISMTACGPGAKSVAVSPRAVSWPEARRLLKDCRVKALEQTHSRLVTLTLRTGGTASTHEPRIDDIFRTLNRLPRKCRPATVATE